MLIFPKPVSDDNIIVDSLVISATILRIASRYYQYLCYNQ